MLKSTYDKRTEHLLEQNRMKDELIMAWNYAIGTSSSEIFKRKGKVTLKGLEAQQKEANKKLREWIKSEPLRKIKNGW